jgi:AraC-like DNA-binding protein
MSPRRRHIDPSATFERSLRLHDEAGQNWFTQRGQRAAGRAPFRVFADSATGSGLTLTRIWHSPATIARDPVDGQGLTVLIQLDGTAQLDLVRTNTSLSLSPEAAVLIPDEEPYVLSAETATARIEIGLRHSLGLVNEGQVINWDDSPYTRVLVAAVNAALNTTTIDPASAGYGHLKAAIRGLLFASSASIPEAAFTPLKGNAAVLFQRAQAVIERDAVKPEFRVADLAAELRVSQVYLRRIFSQVGTSPLKAIRDARVRNAHDHLQHARPNPSRAELQRIARTAGFSSVRHMRESLAATSDPAQHPTEPS